MGHHVSAMLLPKSAAASQNDCAACHSALSRNPMTCHDETDAGELLNPFWSI
jgi:hypothetical protein